MVYGDLFDFGDVVQLMVMLQDECCFGEQLMLQFCVSGGYFDDLEVNVYLVVIGQWLVVGLMVSYLEFIFFVVLLLEINVFVMFGGFIGVNIGLILVVCSESELVLVLVYEIIYVIQYYIVC